MERLIISEGECIPWVYDDLLGSKRIIQDWNSYVYSFEKATYILESSVKHIFQKNCENYYERNDIRILGNELYQKEVFSKLISIANYFGGHKVKGNQGFETMLNVLPTSPLEVGPEAFQDTIVQAPTLLNISDDIEMMLDAGLTNMYELVKFE